MDNRIIPEGGTNPYASHPGFEAEGCKLRTTVTDDNMGSIRGGFSCYHTGGHCLPHDKEACEKRRKSFDARKEFNQLMESGEPIPDALMRKVFGQSPTERG